MKQCPVFSRNSEFWWFESKKETEGIHLGSHFVLLSNSGQEKQKRRHQVQSKKSCLFLEEQQFFPFDLVLQCYFSLWLQLATNTKFRVLFSGSEWVIHDTRETSAGPSRVVRAASSIHVLLSGPRQGNDDTSG